MARSCIAFLVLYATAMVAAAVWWTAPVEWFILGEPVIVRRIFAGGRWVCTRVLE